MDIALLRAYLPDRSGWRTTVILVLAVLLAAGLVALAAIAVGAIGLSGPAEPELLAPFRWRPSLRVA